MINIVKMKNASSLFAKLVGLAVVFSVVSCECDKKGENTSKVTMTAAIDKATKKVTLTLNAKEDVKLDNYKVKLEKVEAFKDTKRDEKNVVKDGVKVNGFNVGDTKKITDLVKDVSEIKQGTPLNVPIDLTIDATVKVATITFDLLEGDKIVQSAVKAELK